MHLFSLISHSIKSFKTNYKTAHIIAHHDTDGICAAAILIRFLRKKRINYRTTVIPNMSTSIIRKLEGKKSDVFFFVDIGTSYIKEIGEHISKDVYILDHHFAKKVRKKKNITVINPYYTKAYEEVSGAGVVYFFTKALEPSIKKYAYLGVLGAIGDCQDKEPGGMKELNRIILDEAAPYIKRKISHNTEEYLLKIHKDIPENAQEFSTLLNACGRQGYGHIGIKASLLEKNAIDKAKYLSNDYRTKIREALEWYKNNIHISSKNYIIIDAKRNISATIIGTLTSMLARSDNHHKGKIIVSLAEEKNKIKISARYIGKKKIEMRILMEEATKRIKESSYGGHKNAAGALIKKDQKEKFLETLEEILKKI
jgi:single-stranded DNA-specific DHH superfamily exonuclease